MENISAAEKAMMRNTVRIESIVGTLATVGKIFADTDYRKAATDKVSLEADRLRRDAGIDDGNGERDLNDFYSDIKPTLNPVLRSFWTTQARNKVLYGGRSSSKSWDAAGIAIFLSNKYSLRFCCARQIQNKIEESVYTLLKIQIDRFGLRHRFRILNNKIINRVTGSEFVFYGLWRNIEEIKSLEGISVLWLEEAHALTEYQWKILEPTIRKEGSECWFIFNPGLVTDFVWRNFVVDPPEDTLIRKINYDENPFCPTRC